MQVRKFKCRDCGHEWEVPYGAGKSGRQMECPKCSSANIHRSGADKPGRGRGQSSEGRRRGGAGRGLRG